MNVKELKVIEHGPKDNLIEWLEELLAHAKTGELQEMACACGWKDGAVGEGWVLSGRQNFRMLGCLEVLKHKICGMLD